MLKVQPRVLLFVDPLDLLSNVLFFLRALVFVNNLQRIKLVLALDQETSFNDIVVHLISKAGSGANKQLVSVCLLRYVRKSAIDATFVVVRCNLSLSMQHRNNVLSLVLPHYVIFFDLFALHRLQPDIHNGATHLNYPSLRWLQYEIVLNLNKRAKL